MKKLYSIISLLTITAASAQIGDAIHCGYDFTSYIVVKPHEDGKTQTINGLKMTICDENGNEVINKDFKLSWKNNNQPLNFVRNYKTSFIANVQQHNTFVPSFDNLTNTYIKFNWLFAFVRIIKNLSAS